MSFALVLVVLFLLTTLVIGYYTKRWVRSGSDFFVAGREITAFVMFASMASVAFSGSFTVIGPQFAVQFGFWVPVGFIGGYAITFAFSALTTYPYMKKTGVYSVPELFKVRFGVASRASIAIGLITAYIIVIGANLAGAGFAASATLGWNFTTTVLVLTAVIIIYHAMAGAWSATVNDLTLFAIGFVIYFGALVSLVVVNGGWGFLSETLGSRSLGIVGPGGEIVGRTLDLGSSVTTPGAPILSGGLVSFTYFLIGWWLFNAVSQHNYLKVAATRSLRAARVGILWAAGFTILYAFMLSIFGLYGLAATILNGEETINPFLAFDAMLGLLPTWLVPLVVAAVIAHAMTTTSAVLMAATALGARDLYEGLVNPGATPKEMVLPGRIAVGITALLGAALAFYPGGPAQLLGLATAFFAVPVIPLVLSIWWRQSSPVAALVATVCGFLSVPVWLYGFPALAVEFHPVYVAALVTLVVFVPLNAALRTRYFGRSDWTYASDLEPERADS